MKKGINLAARDFRVGLYGLINGCGLPACVVRAELSAALAEVQRIEAEQIRAEQQEAENEKGDTDGNNQDSGAGADA